MGLRNTLLINELNMKNKEHVIRLLEKLEGKFAQLDFITTRQEPLETYKKVLEEGREIISDVKTAIER
tara:strand:+ start:99 stop:302 length:204 start_codon:yes stop_codon:yes gene_type:complete